VVTHIQECHDDLNWCTPYRGRTWPTCHTRGPSGVTYDNRVPTKSNLGPCSQDEVLAPTDRPVQLSSWAASFSLQQTASKHGGTHQQSIQGPINPTCGHYKSKLVHRGQNSMVLNQHRWGLPPWNLGIAMALSPPFPSEWYTFPYLSRPVTTTYMNINIVSTHHILLVHEKEVLHASGTYHSSCTDDYQLSIAHLVIKR
jgi:hypothetical protein